MLVTVLFHQVIEFGQVPALVSLFEFRCQDVAQFMRKRLHLKKLSH